MAPPRTIQVGLNRHAFRMGHDPWFLDTVGDLRDELELENQDRHETRHLAGIRRFLNGHVALSWTLDTNGVVRRQWWSEGRRTVRGLPRVIDLVGPYPLTALAENGTVWLWSEREAQPGVAGRLRLTPTVPIRIADLPPASQIIGGWGPHCAVSDGALWCWQRLALDDPNEQPHAIRIEWPTRIRRIAGSGRTLCALDEQGAVRCAELGPGRLPQVIRARDVAGVEDARDIAVLPGGACAALATGRVRCWGTRMDAAPTGGARVRFEFGDVTGLPPVASMASSRDLVCAVTLPGEAWCWGANDAHQIDASGVDRPTPRRIEGLSNIVRVGVGDQYACALDTRGAVSCWGKHATDRWEPPKWLGPDPGGPRLIRGIGVSHELAVGPEGACATDSQGVVHCWTNAMSKVPQRVLVEAPLRDVTAMGRGFCAREGARGVVCWRIQSWRDSCEVDWRRLPGLVALLPSQNDDQCFLAVDRSVSCWHGQSLWRLESNDMQPYHLPPDGLRVALAGMDTCTVFRDGRAQCDAPPLDGSMQSGVIDVVMSGHLICLLHDDGRVSCAGRNARGQLGDGAPSPDIVAEAVVEP